MQHPPYLQQGALIGITCPSGYMPMERIVHAISVLEQWGFKVKVGKTAGMDKGIYFSGNDEDRRDDLQAMLDDPEIDAILMGRGGYGLSRIIDALDFTAFLNKPKWICGFSDITVLHSHIMAQYHIPTLHSPMCGAFKPGTEDSSYIRSLHEALTGAALRYQLPAARYNRNGTASAIITGGNLSLLAHLIGTASDVDTDGKILFIEDTGEYLYHIDRLLVQLKRTGKLAGLAGLLVGHFDNMKEVTRPFGQNIVEIIWDKVKDYDYPVCFNFPAGHEDINYSLRLGMEHQLTVNDSGTVLEQLG
ncbi:MAG: LD-carboxypeptidase [Bacteroidetes bacterium 46-16]|nr:MAG: LD-carboxypeptidase [Bacteroidetes bacterium 46-16]